ncbi:hypothetical protein Pfo_005645 [Paulownia fortunei]|nr:hypothetical protein Pfo_005645 [Paulownia fortunei]
MEDNERERDLIVPFIYTLFCLCVSIGGILLVLYVFFPTLSQPWHPIAALVLIGSTWLFWVLTYLYACIKGCCRRDRQIYTRQTTTSAMQKDSGSRAGHQQGGKQDSSIASSTDSEIPLAYSA